ncbi:hypothetical protein Q9189_006373 [Teloschistes chrysophthalmus]
MGAISPSMPSSEALTDEYLARLLAKDAHDHRFTSHGLQVGLPKRPISNAPKPNTRFLKNIIKETDNHNAALKAKEVADARTPLLPTSAMCTDIVIIANTTTEGRARKAHHLIQTGEDEGDRDADIEAEVYHQSTTEIDGKRLPHADTNHDLDLPEEATITPTAAIINPAHLHAPAPLPHKDPADPIYRMATTAQLTPPPPPPPQTQTQTRTPLPLSITSNIDTHFNSTYDPSTDITPNIPAESDDWDNALEALRDRARWKASGAERLREAGFSDEAVRKWERGGEGKEEEVAWKGRGEGREWDRGKVVGPDGVQTGAEWGRLKGT